MLPTWRCPVCGMQRASLSTPHHLHSEGVFTKFVPAEPAVTEMPLAVAPESPSEEPAKPAPKKRARAPKAKPAG